MLLANVTVAKKIYDSFPEVSILRNHPPPKQNIMERVEKVLHKYGFKLDGTSSKSLQVRFSLIMILKTYSLFSYILFSGFSLA